ncbi:MAG: alpha/beta hydrolase-fold protein [Verrucomicrobiota bacterium]
MKELLVALALFSPVVHPDRTVTFNLTAPGAAKVALNCESLGSHEMAKGDGGVWTYTSPALAPDVYSYSFTLDGTKVVDPSNPDLKTGYFGNESMVLVPGGGAAAPWEPRDVPHGVIHRHPYRSQIAKHDRECWVYTPPGYDPKSAKPLPVLYLLHGFSDGVDGWTRAGRAHVILDNLLADNKIVPMVVVMPLGYGDMSVLSNGWNGRQKDNAWEKSLAGFDLALMREVLPLAEANYRVRSDAAGRAVAGLSMGGCESIQSALLHPDTFGWVGAFSSGGLPADLDAAFPAAKDSLNSQFKLLWIACGKQDGLLKANQNLVAWLDQKGIKHAWTETEGAHAWGVWRRNLAAFTPLLFRDSGGIAAPGLRR